MYQSQKDIKAHAPQRVDWVGSDLRYNFRRN